MSLILALLLTLQPVAQQQPAQATTASVVGEWDLTFDTPQGSNVARVTFKQENEHVTASLVVPLGTVELSGNESPDGNLKMTGMADLQGTSLPLALGARVTGDTMTGLVTLGTLGELVFSGKRPDKASPANESSAMPAQPADPSMVSGKWNVTLALANMGAFLLTAVLEQHGDQVTGTLNSPLGPLAVTGTMMSGSLQLECVTETPQGNITVTMTGQLGPNGLTGKASVSGIGEAEWTGSREK